MFYSTDKLLLAIFKPSLIKTSSRLTCVRKDSEACTFSRESKAPPLLPLAHVFHHVRWSVPPPPSLCQIRVDWNEIPLEMQSGHAHSIPANLACPLMCTCVWVKREIKWIPQRKIPTRNCGLCKPTPLYTQTQCFAQMSISFTPNLFAKQLLNLSSTNRCKCHTMTKEKCKKILEMCINLVVEDWFQYIWKIVMLQVSAEHYIPVFCVICTVI